jgi:hypothetical protein
MITLLLIFNARLHPSLNVPGLKGEFKENSSQGGTLLSEISFNNLLAYSRIQCIIFSVSYTKKALSINPINSISGFQEKQ